MSRKEELRKDFVTRRSDKFTGMDATEDILEEVMGMDPTCVATHPDYPDIQGEGASPSEAEEDLLSQIL